MPVVTKPRVSAYMKGLLSSQRKRSAASGRTSTVGCSQPWDGGAGLSDPASPGTVRTPAASGEALATAVAPREQSGGSSMEAEVGGVVAAAIRVMSAVSETPAFGCATP